MDGKDLGDDLLAASVVSVVVAFSSSVSLMEVCFLVAVETHCQVLCFETFCLVHMDESLYDLPSDEADVVILELDEDLTS